MKNIIVISGKQYSGKDTLANILLNKLDGFKRAGIGDAIKLMYSNTKNIPFSEIEENKHLYRAELIYLGNWGRQIDKNFWLEYLAGMTNIIVPDVRVMDELLYFKEKGAFLIRVESEYSQRLKRGIITKENDYTETALDNYHDWDFVVNNNSDIEKLQKDADIIVSML